VLSILGTFPQYQASFRRQGFADDDVATLSDRLLDALVPWGDADAVAARLRELLDAGADHVAVSVAVEDPAVALAGWGELAERLLR
jgi:hypothetical protein